MAGHLNRFSQRGRPIGPGYRMCTLHAFHQDHVCPGRAVAHLARLAIFFAVQPLFGALRRIELEDDNTFGLPLAFEHFGFAAAHDVFSAVLFHGSTGELLVFFIADRIEDLDFDDDVSGHESVKGLKREIYGPLWLRSFAASSGIFLRRRSRNQLFHVLRKLSRGVWYFWFSSLLFRICA